MDANIFGGFDQSDGDAVDNTVTLSGAPKFNSEKLIRGGRVIGGSDSFSGNTLNVSEYTGSSVGNIIGFQYFNFTLPENLSEGETILKVNGTVYLNDTVNDDAQAEKSSQIKGISLGKNTNITVGGTIVLIEADTLDTTSFTQDGQTVDVTDGEGKSTWTLSVDTASTPNKLKATLKEEAENGSGGGCNSGWPFALAGLVLAALVKKKRYIIKIGEKGEKVPAETTLYDWAALKNVIIRRLFCFMMCSLYKKYK